LSTRAAEQTGFKAVLLSRGVLAYSIFGVLDIALITADELLCDGSNIIVFFLPSHGGLSPKEQRASLSMDYNNGL
jgi:hypothetical protein